MSGAQAFPLCNAIRAEAWGLVDDILCSTPVKNTREIDKSGATPLHWAACVGNAQLVGRLLELYPDAAEIQDKFSQRLPLHYATFYWTRTAKTEGMTYDRAESIEELVIKFPRGSQIQDAQGNIPLKYALDENAPPESLQMLERATYPTMVPILDEYYSWSRLNEWTKDPTMFKKMISNIDRYLLNPLQHAVTKDAPVSLVESMISTNPELLQSFDSRRRSLLHLAASVNADSEIIELLVKHIPHAARERDLNHKLPLEYVLEHQDSDTVGGQENIFTLLRVHTAPLWDHRTRDRLLQISDVEEIAQLVTDSLERELSIQKNDLLLFASNKSNNRQDFTSELESTVEGTGLLAPFSEQWRQHAHRLMQPWLRTWPSVGREQRKNKSERATNHDFLPFYLIVHPLHRHFEICTEYLLQPNNDFDSSGKSGNHVSEAKQTYIARQKVKMRSQKLMFQMRRLALRTADQARRPVTAALQQRADSSSVASSILPESSVVRSKWTKSYEAAYIQPTITLLRKTISSQIQLARGNNSLTSQLLTTCTDFFETYGNFFDSGIRSIREEGRGFISLVEESIRMQAVVELHHPQDSIVQDETSFANLPDMYRVAANGKCTLAIEQLLETLNTEFAEPCYQFYQLDGDAPEEFADFSSAHYLAFAPGFCGSLPPRGGWAEDATGPRLCASSSFLKPFGAAVEREVLLQSLAAHTDNSSSVPPHLQIKDIVRAVVVCRNCVQMEETIKRLQAQHNTLHTLSEPEQPQSLLSKDTHPQPAEVARIGYDAYTARIVKVAPQRLLSPHDGSWLDIVVIVEICIQSSRSETVAQRKMLCEIRLVHSANLSIAKDLQNPSQFFCEYWVNYRAFRYAKQMLQCIQVAVPSPPKKDPDAQSESTITKQRGRERLGQAKKIDKMLTNLQSARIADAQRIEELTQQIAQRDQEIEDLRYEMEDMKATFEKERLQFKAQMEQQLQRFATLASEKIVEARERPLDKGEAVITDKHTFQVAASRIIEHATQSVAAQSVE